MRDVMLIIHFIGLAMGLGVSFAHMFLGKAGSKLSAEDALKFRMHSLALSKMGHIGLTILILSGGYLMTPYWEFLPTMPFMIAKLVMVVVLTVLIVYIGNLAKQARAGDPVPVFKKMEPVGKLTLISALAIVILAVLNFH